MNKYPSFGILIIDDEPAWLKGLSLTLKSSAGVTNTFMCQDGREAMSIIDRGGIGLVLLDLTMPHLPGEELLKQIGERHPEITTIIVSGLNQLDTAVRCMKLGAYDYFIKTDEEDRIVGGVLRAVRMLEMRREYQEMSDHLVSGTLSHPEAFAGIITRDHAMQAVFAYIEAVAGSPQPLMITGESGVGKELLAKAVHQLGARRGKLVTVNVAGLDDAVFSDTLFGHVRGAFTGADGVRNGMVEEAANGTLFLDEIGDLAIPSQVKLLRLLQEGEYFPLGSDHPKRLSARIVVATHQDLAAKEAAGTFRRDLYYRLRTHFIEVPPLRKRKDDLRFLMEHFLEEAARVLGREMPTLPPELMPLLMTYPFPGNVRELKSMVYDAVSLHKGGVLSVNHFRRAIGQAAHDPEKTGVHPRENPFAHFESLPTFTQAAELLIDEALSRANGNQTVAARLLTISQPSLWKRIKRGHR
ncbi:sigma-54-dependent Fis family transcriptional regulator [Geobacter sp. FeAm09]|uniref:sigma-54-dependent transcriptional regulator n=1 Tax=Geobacter sp. FeAm09 TaxID=2597769 RepID=UPI0011EC7440|nr:sigma-54 dependent transcriptional regulator [Geobacter sp. FeAm09]QEM69305.1 sigma-54-dependent Fis family transcriptional regulator [Geobacter sp. FeAm09]